MEVIVVIWMILSLTGVAILDKIESKREEKAKAKAKRAAERAKREAECGYDFAEVIAQTYGAPLPKDKFNLGL